MNCGSLEARWKCRPQRFSALAGNVGSVALVLTINRASLLNRLCQTIQCPAESERWGHGLAVKPSRSYFLSMTTSINLSRPYSWTLPSTIPVRRNKAKDSGCWNQTKAGLSSQSLLAEWFISESPMVQRGENIRICVLDCCQSLTSLSSLLWHSRLACRLSVSYTERANKV